VSAHLVKSARLWEDPQQGAAGFVGASDEFNRALRFLQNALVVLHGSLDAHRFLMCEVPTHEGDVGLAAILERLLERSSPGLLLGEQQTPGGLEVEPVNRVDPFPHLVSDPLKTRFRLGVVDIAMDQQPRGLGDDDPVGGLG